MSQSIDEILEAAEGNAVPLDWGKRESRQLAAEVRKLRKRVKELESEVATPILVATNRLANQLADSCEWEKVLTKALETAYDSMLEHRAYCAAWEHKYGEVWDELDENIRAVLATSQDTNTDTDADPS